MILSGLGLVATHFTDDVTRGMMIGRVQGGVALGVVLGYPMGGLLYHLTDSPAPPFFILAGCSGILIGRTKRKLIIKIYFKYLNLFSVSFRCNDRRTETMEGRLQSFERKN